MLGRSSAVPSNRSPAVEHMGAQPSWSGLHMLRSGVQAVSIAPYMEGSWGARERRGGFLLDLGRAAGPPALYQEDKS